MYKVLLSIKTKYANQIFAGTKQFEFRKRRISKLQPNDLCLVYSSGVDKKVIGEFTVRSFYTGKLHSILDVIRTIKGDAVADAIDLDSIYTYYGNDIVKANAYVIEITNPVLYSEPLPISKVYSGSPPMSFAYID